MKPDTWRDETQMSAKAIRAMRIVGIVILAFFVVHTIASGNCTAFDGIAERLDGNPTGLDDYQYDRMVSLLDFCERYENGEISAVELSSKAEAVHDYLDGAEETGDIVADSVVDRASTIALLIQFDADSIAYDYGTDNLYEHVDDLRRFVETGSTIPDDDD